MLHTGTYCILVHNISEMNEKNGGNLILHSSRGLIGIRNLAGSLGGRRESCRAVLGSGSRKKMKSLTLSSTQLRS